MIQALLDHHLGVELEAVIDRDAERRRIDHALTPNRGAQIAGLTKTGTTAARLRPARLHGRAKRAWRRVMYGKIGRPACSRSRFITSLSIATAEPSTPAPT